MVPFQGRHVNFHGVVISTTPGKQPPVKHRKNKQQTYDLDDLGSLPLSPEMGPQDFQSPSMRGFPWKFRLESSDLLIPSNLWPVFMLGCHERGGERSNHIQPVGGWSNPFRKYAQNIQNGPSSQILGVNIKLFETTPIYLLTFEDDPFM